MLAVVWSVWKRKSGCSQTSSRILWEGTTKANIRDHMGSPLHMMWHASILGLQEGDATSEALWGCQAETPLPRPPCTAGYLADLKKCHQQLMSSARRDNHPHLGGHRAWLSSFKKLSKGQLPWAMWGQPFCQHPLSKLIWKLFSKKHSPSSFL